VVPACARRKYCPDGGKEPNPKRILTSRCSDPIFEGSSTNTVNVMLTGGTIVVPQSKGYAMLAGLALAETIETGPARTTLPDRSGPAPGAPAAGVPVGAQAARIILNNINRIEALVFISVLLLWQTYH
jgi:hypothetical protein